MMISRISGYTPASYNTPTRQVMSAQSFGKNFDLMTSVAYLKQNQSYCNDEDINKLIEIVKRPDFTEHTKLSQYFVCIESIKDKTVELSQLNKELRKLRNLQAEGFRGYSTKIEWLEKRIGYIDIEIAQLTKQQNDLGKEIIASYSGKSK